MRSEVVTSSSLIDITQIEDPWDLESASRQSSLAEPDYFDSAATAEAGNAFWDQFPSCLSDPQESWNCQLTSTSWASVSLLDPVQMPLQVNLGAQSYYPDTFLYNFPSGAIVDMNTVNDSGTMTRLPSLAPTDDTSSDTFSELSTIGSPRFSPSNCAGSRHTCSQCYQHFSRVAEMEDHARETKHKPFACSLCPKHFSRQDALTRHGEIHKSQKRYSCEFCEKYRGPHAFKRRDHLRQHLRKKHRVHPNSEFPRYCSYERCSSSSSESSFGGFLSRREFSKHMRDSHGEETHDCEVDGCHRVGRKGFARLSDLEKHRRSIHEKETKLED